MSALKCMCAIAVMVGLNSAVQAQLNLIDDDAAATIQANSDLTDLQVNVNSGPGAGLPDHLDHVDKHSLYVDGAHVSSLDGPGLTGSTANTADYSYGGQGGLHVDVSFALGGSATAGDDPDGHYTATYHATFVVTNNSTAPTSTSLVSVQDFTLTRFAQSGGFASGPSTENAVVTGAGDQEITQTEIGDVNGFLISKLVSTFVANEDLDNDGFVGDPDLNIVLGNFGTSVTGGRSDADLDGDGVVGDPDLNLLLSAFGTKTVSKVEVASDGGIETRVLAGNDLSGTTDTSVAGPNTGDDINISFQVDTTLLPGQSRTFISTYQLTPEPASLALLGLGATLLAARRSSPQLKSQTRDA